MSKGQARNMQRISLKVTAGTARQLEGGMKQPPVLKQLQAMEVDRLARIRFGFDVEQQISDATAAGQNVGLLREKLAGIRNGSIAVPKGYGARPTGLSLKALPDAHKTSRPRRNRAKPLYASERQAAADIADLSKGKLTMTGVATVKGLLERFDALFVEATLECPIGFIDRVQASAVYALAPPLQPADGQMLVDALEARSPNIHPADRLTPVERDTNSEPGF